MSQLGIIHPHRKYIYNARDIVTSELNSRLNSLAKSVTVSGKRFVVYNALPWKRSGLVELPRAEGKSIFVKDVPPNGYVTISEKELKNDNISSDKDSILVTPHFTAVFDLKKGGISSLKEKGSNREWVDQSSPYVIGQFLHERFSSNEIDLWKNTYGISNIWGIHD